MANIDLAVQLAGPTRLPPTAALHIGSLEIPWRSAAFDYLGYHCSTTTSHPPHHRRPNGTDVRPLDGEMLQKQLSALH